MARRGDSVVGIDLGKHVFKAVALQRRNDSRFVLTNFALCKAPEIICYSGRAGARNKGSDERAWEQWKRLRRRCFRRRFAPSYYRAAKHAGGIVAQRASTERTGRAEPGMQGVRPRRRAGQFAGARGRDRRSPKEAAPRCRLRWQRRHAISSAACCAPK